MADQLTTADITLAEEQLYHPLAEAVLSNLVCYKHKRTRSGQALFEQDRNYLARELALRAKLIYRRYSI